jgi:hypothetical protein
MEHVLSGNMMGFDKLNPAACHLDWVQPTGGYPQRSCAGMGDGRNGLLPRLRGAFFGIFLAMGFSPFRQRVHAPTHRSYRELLAGWLQHSKS